MSGLVQGRAGVPGGFLQVTIERHNNVVTHTSLVTSSSFVVNPLTPRQETVCLLQNGTAANNPSAQPLRSVSQYYMVKMSVRSDKVCKRPWNFERVPNKMIEGHDKALIFTSTKEACLAACLNEVRECTAVY